MGCLNCSSASADNSELPKALRHQQDHQLCHLTQHRHSHSILPPGQTYIHTLLPFLCWLQGHRAPSHHQQTPGTITSLQSSHRTLHLLTKLGLPPVRELFVWPTTILTQDLFFKKGLRASLSAPKYPFGSIKCGGNLLKKENQGLSPSKRGRSCFVGFLSSSPSPLHLYFISTLKVSISSPPWNDIFLVEPILKQAKF